MGACAAPGAARSRTAASGNARQQRCQLDAQARGRPPVSAVEPAVRKANPALPSVELGAYRDISRRGRIVVRAILRTHDKMRVTPRLQSVPDALFQFHFKSYVIFGVGCACAPIAGWCASAPSSN